MIYKSAQHAGRPSWSVTLDFSLSHPPALIPTFLRKLMPFLNLNTPVRVRLTARGCSVYQRFRADLNSPSEEHRLGVPIAVGVDLEFAMWELMQVFGSAVYNGMPGVVFEGNHIELAEAALD
ncbi:hypothetical protein F6X40_11260 [Paraburkholderia sp. UCT31]|uniref:hypothetical protein n=1 Tax=Paraburkholderia sp. UCT31 TaxID=2615209 RepID=UPI00165642C0|nr:hypothetical protein [Paraburkholderia sp. UCT31]MBC8737382.1 hypothetical protein [Paraburkholderia sp. UCT31]